MIDGKIVSEYMTKILQAQSVPSVTRITSDLSDTVEFLRKIAEIRKKDIADARKGY